MDVSRTRSPICTSKSSAKAHVPPAITTRGLLFPCAHCSATTYIIRLSHSRTSCLAWGHPPRMKLAMLFWSASPARPVGDSGNKSTQSNARLPTMYFTSVEVRLLCCRVGSALAGGKRPAKMKRRSPGRAMPGSKMQALQGVAIAARAAAAAAASVVKKDACTGQTDAGGAKQAAPDG